MTELSAKVALVGMACRLPSATGLDAFWDVLAESRCVITEVQQDRFGTDQHWHPDRTRPGRAVTFAAGQLDRPYDFDPGYFGISPREAAAMDPQQRVMLEVAVEALENAGIPADRLAGTEVGIYVGASSLDYGTHAQLDPASIEPQSMTGNTLSIIANRLSYAFDLRGPSYVVDTACSSSLIALHNAVEAIRSGAIETAIVGGVSLLLHPVPFIGFSRASMLSATGLCRAFDAGADGYVRSEGAVAFVLRAEDLARREGDRVRARIVASGINADGRTNGLSLPSMEAQASLLAKVYGNTIDPDDLAFVEAHGTGTRVGDPIETEAIGRVLGVRRRQPLLIGSAKTNFGHLEPASGLVGVLKAQMALERDLLPASLHFDTPNPDIRFAELNLAVAAAPTPLGRGGTRLAGINSFGFGGANSHVVIADGDPAEPVAATHHDAPLVISAASRASLAALATAAAGRIAAGADAALYANAAAHGRQRLAWRAVVAAAPAAEMTAALHAVAAGKEHRLAVTGEALRVETPVFVYSGNGSQWAGMGRAAYQDCTDFRLSFDRTDRLFMSLAGWSLVTMLFSEDLEGEIERTEIAQPLLFALQVALTDALARRGLSPSLVIGHSVGEVAAAWAAGALTLADAVRVIHARSTHQEVTRHLGGMAALLLPPDEARAAIAPFAGVELAAINSPRSVTISGPTEQIAAFAKAARGKRWAVKKLELDYPFHCALVEPIHGPLTAALTGIAPRRAKVPMISTVTGRAVAGSELGAAYWWDNVRRPVLFSAAAGEALAAHRLFVEIGPRPVLTAYLTDVARAAEVRAVVLPSFRQNDASADTVGHVLRAVVASGGAVDEAVLFGRRRAAADILPTYPWAHESFRSAESAERVRLKDRRDHVLLGDRLREDQHTWHVALDARRLPFLADHRIENAVVFPAAGFTEMLLAAGRIIHPGAAIELRDLDIYAPLLLDAEDEREVRTREVAPATFVIESRLRLSDDGFAPHVKATVGRAPAAPHAAPAQHGEGRSVPAATLYEMTAAFGLPYGPVFRRANLVTLLGEDAAPVRRAPADPATARQNFALDPTLFDSCFHALFAFLADRSAETGSAVLPVRIGRLVLAAAAAPPTEADIAVRLPSEGIVEADFVLRDGSGAVVATADAVRFQAVPLGRGGGAETIVAAPVLKRVTRAKDAATLVPVLPAALVGETEPSETALLVEVGVQAAAAAVLAPLFAEPTTLPALVSRKRVAEGAVPLVARLLAALEAAGVVAETGDGWHVGTAGAAEVSDVVGLLVGEHPERLAEAAFIAALPLWLAGVVAGGLGERHPAAPALIDQLLTDAPFAAPAYAALEAAAAALFSTRGSEAARIAVVCAGNVPFLRRLAALVDPASVRLVISDRDASALERTRLVWERVPGVELTAYDDLGTGGHPFDAVLLPPSLDPVDLGALAELMKPGGVVLGAAFAPSLFADAVGGLSAAWWSGSADAESPVGRLSTAEEWRASLAAAGCEAEAVAPVAAADTDALLFSARRSALAEARPPLVLPSLHAAGDAARKMCDALAAMGEARVAGLDVVPDGACLVALDEPDPAALPERLAEFGVFLVALGTADRAVTVVTFGAAAEGANEVRPTAAALAAFARVAMNEFPHLDVRLVDIAPTFAPSEAAVRLVGELAEPNAEREIVLTSDLRAAMRYLPLPRVDGVGEASVLAVPRRGSIDHLAWQRTALPALAPGEVRLKVEATGLNFRDVMWTLGLLPHEALEDGFAGPTLGMECAGVIEAVGEGVSLAPGEKVVAFAPACFASHVTVRAEAVARRPSGLSAEAAATIPVAFLTAYYALVELGRLEEGETVLIHGGAGGVGLAALQIARARGARVFATAGSVEKRALLIELGADAVFDSRSLTFADEAIAASGGEGVDVVLNSLAGEAMERSLGALKPFGRFLELGKRDFYADTKLGLRPFRQNLSYFGIDADQLMKHRPRLAARLLAEIIDLFERGDLTALPYRTFDAGGVKAAFRLMQSAGHIGKIVVSAPPLRAPARAPVPLVDPAKAYLLVGGTSGFGFATAEWLIAEGARRVVLASRSGVRDAAILARIAEHRSAGVEVEVVALDVTDLAAVSALVARLAAGAGLGGVFHMAMVLDDALIASLDAARHRTVLTPKILGAIALEAALKDVRVDLFVLYSSLTVELGNPGQANYVAANAYLEAVARRRRARGKPALAIAWGAIADVGVVAREVKTSELLARKLGRHAITAAEGLAELKRQVAGGAMTSGPAVRLIGKVDWAAARKDLRLARSPAFEDLADLAPDDADAAGSVDLAERLAGLSDVEATAEVVKLLAGEISRILKLPVAEVDAHKPLTALGMDSLMGVELRMAAETRLGVDIPLMSLAAGATLTDIARKIVQRGRGDEPVPDEAAEALIARHIGDHARPAGEIVEIEAAVRRKTAGVGTILS